MKNILKSICEKTKLDKKAMIIIFIGLMGVMLLTVSELIPEKEVEEESTETAQSADYYDYADEIEKKLEKIISSIYGAGKTKVMVTLDCSDESVYATEEKINESSRENKVVIVENQDGEGGVLLKITQPRVRGVAVVCEGGASPSVRQSITKTITAVLDISSARISIATMKKDNGG